MSFCDARGWRITWRDEFNSPKLDAKRWNVLHSTHDDVNADCHGKTCDLLGGCRDAACMLDDVYVRNGRLVLSSQRRVALGRNFTTGAVTTRDLATFRVGESGQPFRMCISAILPGVAGRAAGVWPAHWLMPNTDACDPDEGEMDITEMVDGDGKLYSTYHWQDAGAPPCAYPKFHSHVFSNSTLARGWNATLHEFAVERGAAHVAFALDGKVVLNASAADPSTPKAKRPVFSAVPWYLILNTAIGGGWPGPATADTAFPLRHEIDYVRVARPFGERMG